MDKVKSISKFNEELDKICGFEKAKETLRNYFNYVQLRQQCQIEGLGNYNIFIKVSDNYSKINQIIEIINNTLKDIGVIDKDYYEVKQREITTNLSKIDNDIILLGDKVNFSMLSTLELLPQYIRNNDNKIFILVYNQIIPKKLQKSSPIEELTEGLFAWKLEISGEYTEEEKQNYISKKLQDNNIKVKSNTFINELVKEDISKIDKELMYITVKSKANKQNIITDKFLEKVNRTQYISNKKIYGKSAMQELDELIGLENIKAQIKQLVNFIKINKLRGQLPTLHMAFLGPSGCGKTNVARLVNKILKEEGILKGNFIEATRSDLVAAYIGQTAIKTKEIINRALGGILFIDERI